MAGYALGLIETVGLPAAMEAADAAVKAADVTLIGYELAKGGGLVTVKLEGEVSAVQAAVQSGCAAAARVRKVYSSLVIARPHKDLEQLTRSKENIGKRKPETIAPGDETIQDVPENDMSPVEAVTEEATAEVPGEEIEPETADATAKEEPAPVPGEETETESAAQATAAGEGSGQETGAGAEPDDAAAGDVGSDVEEKEPETDVKQPEPEKKEDLQDFNPVQEEPTAGSDMLAAEPAEKVKEGPADEATGQDFICNLCHDPACTRRKGGPRTACIHYKKRK
ncbi:MAG: BMC domain-containing protein [Bacillota bacterium]